MKWTFVSLLFLAVVAVGFHAVAAGEGEEELALPWIRNTELKLFGIAGKLVELVFEAFEGVQRGGHFAGGVGAEIEGLNLLDFFD